MEYLIKTNKNTNNSFLNQSATEYRKQFSKTFYKQRKYIDLHEHMSRVTTHIKTTLVTSLTLRITTASRNAKCYLTLK